jgi:hypothetical protein
VNGHFQGNPPPAVPSLPASANGLAKSKRPSHDAITDIEVLWTIPSHPQGEKFIGQVERLSRRLSLFEPERRPEFVMPADGP